MRSLSEVSVKRPISIFMLVLMVLLLGAVSFSKLRVDLFPEMNLPIAVVVANYEGAGPEEIEKLVTRPLEEAVATVSGVESVSSVTQPGSSIVITQYGWGTDMDFATLSMREKVDMVQGFLPDEVDKPTVFKFDPNMLPIVSYGVSGDLDLDTLKEIAEDKIKPRLERLEGVAAVNVHGGLTREIQIIVDPSKLQAYGLSMQQISGAIFQENRNLAGGKLEEAQKQYMVRITGEFDSVKQIEEVNVATATGGLIKVRDVAEVKDAYKEVDSYIKVSGTPGVWMEIQKQTNANTVLTTKRVNAEIASILTELPETVKIESFFEMAEYINQSINGVKRTGMIGAILAVFILYLFLRNIRSTLIIGTAIPFSVITTFLLVHFAGFSLNMMTLGGLALGIGMMVDSSIVILENIYRYRENGYSRIDAAVEGASEVGAAVMASTFTTIVVFLPIVYVEGLASQIFRPLAATIAFALMASLIVSLTLIPTLSSKILKVANENGNGNGKKIGKKMSRKFGEVFTKVEQKYAGLLRWSLNHKKIVGLLVIILFVASAAVTPLVGMEFMPNMDNGEFEVRISLAKGSLLEETEAITKQFEDMLINMPEVVNLATVVGQSGGMGVSESGPEIGNIFVILTEKDARQRSIEDVIEDVRDKAKTIPGITLNIVRHDFTGGGGEAPISIAIRGDEFPILQDISDEIITRLHSVEGTREVESSLSEGRPEVHVKINREKASLYGLSASSIADSVRGAIQGQLSTKYRIEGDEIDVKVRVDEAYRNDVRALRDLLIMSPRVGAVPLSEVATLVTGEGPSAINRNNQVREVTVTSQIANRDLGSLMKDIKVALDGLVLPPGYEIEYGGENKDMIEAFTDLALALILAIILVYMIMAAQFEALLYPFIIMFAVPPTFIGVVLGLLLTGRSFNVPAFIGVIMLAGIVVNNAIVLVDYINTLRKRGIELHEAVITAGQTRLRPILMTTLTTVLALVPASLGIGQGSEMQTPMATTVIFGLSFSTLITLILVPVIYMSFSVLGQRFKKRFGKKEDVYIGG